MPTSTADDDNHTKTSVMPRVKAPARKILRQNGPHNFLVLFEDDSKQWTDDVAPMLKKEWRIEQDRRRLNRR